MTRSLSIRELASDIAKLSKTLTILATELESVPTQETVTEAVTPKEAEKSQIQPQAQVDSMKTEATGETKSKEPLKESAKAPVTIEQVRAVMAEKSQAGLTAKVKEVLEAFGAAKLSAVSPEDYEDLLEAAKAIK